MAAGIKLTSDEVARRFESRGFTLLGAYTNQYKKVDARCHAHGETHQVSPANIFRGQGLKCCHRESAKANRTGAIASEETKRKLSEIFSGQGHPRFGKPLSEDTRKRVSDGLKASARSSVEYAINKASTGKTAGKQGYFYMAEAGNGLIKFGSIVRLTPSQRMSFLKSETGGARLLLLAKVDDAGAYEASMMMSYKQHWSHGEYFHPSVLAS